MRQLKPVVQTDDEDASSAFAGTMHQQHQQSTDFVEEELDASELGSGGHPEVDVEARLDDDEAQSSTYACGQM